MQAEALLDHAAFVRELAKSLTFGGEDPDDAVQETWLRAMEHPPVPGPGMKGWLATVLRNVLRQERRARGRRVVREAAAPPPKTMPTPDDIREREAVRTEVVTAVLDLEARYRDVILMRYYEDLPPREIAARTGDPIETVKTRLVRARGKLRERLDDRHGGDGRAWGIAVASLALWPGETKAAPVAGSAIPFAKIALGLVAVAVVAVLAVNQFSTPAGGVVPDRASVVNGADIAPPGETGEAMNRGGGEETPSADGKDAGDPDGAGAAGGAKKDAGAKKGTGARIQGVVRDESTNLPVEGVLVRLCIREEKKTRVVDVLTDEEGKYVFPDVPVGVDVWAFIKGKGRLVSAGGRLATTKLEKGQTIQKDFLSRRREGIDLRVHLVLPEGVAAPEKLRMTITSVRPEMTSVDYQDYEVDPDTLLLTIFLAVGRHRMGFESAGLKGELPPQVVAGDGPPVDVRLTLKGRTGLRLRLVDAEGRSVRRGPIRMLVVLITESRSPMGDVSYGSDSLGYHETDGNGELDLNPVLPALNPDTMHGSAFAFAIEAEGFFKGSMTQPNFRITVKDLIERRRAQDGGLVVIDVPLLPHLSRTFRVRDPDGKPVAGVRVVGRPARYFTDETYVSDGEGNVTTRMVGTPPFAPRPGEARPERLSLVALPPWIGRAEMWQLERGDIPGAPPAGLVVRKAVEITLKLVDDAGEPIAGTEVTVDGAEGRTDAAGVVRCLAAAGVKQVEVKVEGHFSGRVTPAAAGEVATARLVRSREIFVRCRLPDGSLRSYPVFARVVGEEKTYMPTGWNTGPKGVRLIVPRANVRVMTNPRLPGYTGEVEVPVDQKDVVLELKKK